MSSDAERFLPASGSRARAEVELQELALTDPRWGAFVAAHAERGPFHEPGWAQLVADCYGYRAFAAALVGDGEIQAGLPMVEVRRPWGRPRWVCLPFTDHCPPLASGPTTHRQLIARLAAAPAERGVRRVELRGGVHDGHLGSVLVGYRHFLPLDVDHMQVWERAQRNQIRRNIKRGQREGVQVRVGTRAEDLTEDYYRLHLATRRRHGVPIQPRRFFRMLWERQIEPGNGAVYLAEHHGRPVAGGLFLRSGSTVVFKYSASAPDAVGLRPNHVLLWQALQDECARGTRVLDLGRCDLDAEGLRAYKLAWGATEEPLRYTSLGEQSDPAQAGQRRGPAVLARVIRAAPPWVCRAAGEALYRYAA